MCQNGVFNPEKVPKEDKERYRPDPNHIRAAYMSLKGFCDVCWEVEVIHSELEQSEWHILYCFCFMCQNGVFKPDNVQKKDKERYRPDPNHIRAA